MKAEILKKAEQFLRSKGLLKPNKTQFIISGVSTPSGMVILNELLTEFAEEYRNEQVDVEGLQINNPFKRAIRGTEEGKEYYAYIKGWNDFKKALLSQTKVNQPKKGLDLDKISRKIDEVLANTTPEELEQWLLEHRAKQKEVNQPSEEEEPCPLCSGDGYTAEHDPTDPHEFGCSTNCPIQVQCEFCEGTGINPKETKNK